MPNKISETNLKLEHIDLELTRDCNLDCIHCSAGSDRTGTELSIDNIKSILLEAKTLGLTKVGFTGGEPFRRENSLRELVKISLDDIGAKVHIHSNGATISSEIARWIKELGIDITVTLFGSNPKTHDAITNTEGSMESTLEGLQNLLDVDASVSVFVVPMKINLHEVIPMINLVYKKGCRDIRILSLSPTGKAIYKFDELAPSEDDIRFLNKEFIKIQKELDFNLNAGFCTRLRHPVLKIRKGHDSCYSAKNRIHIDALGNVFPCTASSGRMIFSAGNLQMPENTISEIWQYSPLFQFIRKFHSNIPKKCRDCAKYNYCMGGCRVMMAYKYGDFTIADPHCGGPFREKI